MRIWKTRERFLNARDTLRALLDNHIVPVINENDAVATAEIKVGDNDNLCAGGDPRQGLISCCF